MKRLAVVAAVAAVIAAPTGQAHAHTGTRLHRVATCESGHRPHINTGNGHYGAYQFTLSSWRWVGGHGYPHTKTMRRQTVLARRLRDRQGGANAWPYCWPNHWRYA